MVLTAATASVPSMLFEPGRIRTGDLLINGFILRDRKFANRFANFLSPIGCILALYMTQKHCGAAGIAFLLITQLLKTCAATSPICQLLCSILTCLCGPSLFVWAKALQSGQASLPVADPHYRTGAAERPRVGGARRRGGGGAAPAAASSAANSRQKRQPLRKCESAESSCISGLATAMPDRDSVDVIPCCHGNTAAAAAAAAVAASFAKRGCGKFSVDADAVCRPGGWPGRLLLAPLSAQLRSFAQLALPQLRSAPSSSSLSSLAPALRLRVLSSASRSQSPLPQLRLPQLRSQLALIISISSAQASELTLPSFCTIALVLSGQIVGGFGAAISEF
uniref:Uncharacterized protein n=1 Tax=Macrostomum lignano TaxID=282301 RepID=A0A1I8F918_9PLAT